MRMLTFANRNTKEILRDPINLFFGLSPKSVLFTFPFPIREVRFHPFDILLRCDFTVITFITLGDCLIAPLVEFVLFQLMNSYSGSVAFVVFVVNRNRLIVGDFRLVVLQRGKLLAGSGFSLGNAVAVLGIIITLHNKIFAAALALSEADVLLQHFCQLQLQHIFNGTANISCADKHMVL